MGIEVEAKLKVAELEGVRVRLRRANATRIGARLELNAFFDTPDRTLKTKDQGLRLRTMTDEAGEVTCVATFKGPQAGEAGDGLKRREEIEFAVGSYDAAREMLSRLGYVPTLAFEKRRETWRLDGCLVELDELPHLGRFVEIEGDAPSIARVRTTLGVGDLPLIPRGYITMMTRLVEERPELGPIVRFEA